MLWEIAWSVSSAKPTMITDLSRNRNGMPPGSGEPEQVPLELLREHAALVERVPHEDVDEDDEHHEQHDPGHAPAEPFLERVDLSGEPAEHGVFRRMGWQRPASIARTLRSGQRVDITAGFC